MIRLLFTLFIIFNYLASISQQKVYNNTVIKPENVQFNIRIDTQIIYNSSANLAKLYLLNAKTFLLIDSLNQPTGKYGFELTLGNPDSQVVYNSDWDLEFPFAYDTAFFADSKIISFDKFGVRDMFVEYSPDKKHIHYKASYIGANHLQTIYVIFNSKTSLVMTIHRLGKLF